MNDYRLSPTPLLNLKTGKSVCQINSEAHGTEKIFYWVIVVVATGPFTDSSSITGLGEEIANVLRENTKSEKIRIAIMAVESMMDKNSKKHIKTSVRESNRCSL